MIYILGRGGHAKVCAEIVKLCSMECECLTTEEYIPKNAVLTIGIGNLAFRRKFFEQYKETNLLSGLRHPSAIVASDHRPGYEVQIMAGVIIQPGCTIGENVIINTGAQIDHDCIIGSHCHIAPGAILCGGVIVGDGVFIGAGAVIPEGRKIPDNAFIPAGSVFK